VVLLTLNLLLTLNYAKALLRQNWVITSHSWSSAQLFNAERWYKRSSECNF